MAHIYIDTPGSHISKKGETIVINRVGDELLQIPLFEVELVTLVGNVQITTQALTALARRGVRVVMLEARGSLACVTTGHCHKHAQLRLGQYSKYAMESWRLEFARIITWSKLKNCLELLLKHQRSHRETDLEAVIGALRDEMQGVWSVASRQELLGHEGMAARHYYEGFSAMLRNDRFRMHGRNRRPPRDPVNSLLSLGYILLYNEVHAALEGIGLDPYLGFMHEVDYGRASLACDMMEEFRFLVDALVLSVINRQLLAPDDFEPDEATGGIFVKPAARKKFYAAYDQKMKTEVNHHDQTMSYRRMFSHHAALLARVIRDEEYVYVPFQMR